MKEYLRWESVAALLGAIICFTLLFLSMSAPMAYADFTTTYTSTSSASANGEIYYVGRPSQRGNAQKLVIITTGVATQLLSMENDYTAPNDLTVSIQTDSGGNPSGTSVADTTVTAAESSTTCTDFTKSFNSGGAVVLNAGTYWVVWSTVGNNPANFWDSCGDNRYPGPPNDSRDNQSPSPGWQNITTGANRYSITVTSSTTSTTASVMPPSLISFGF